jgi:hypothetical protein
MKIFKIFILAALFCYSNLNAQFDAEQLDMAIKIGPTGELNANYVLTFSANKWRLWKNSIGSDADRVRVSVKYLGSAQAQIDDFKYERDDLNRIAKLNIHSKVGAIYREGRYFFDIDEGYKHIDTNGATWYFSGKTGVVPGTYKVTLPASASDVKLVDVENNQKAISYIIPQSVGSAQRYRNIAIGFLSLCIVLFAVERALYKTANVSSANASIR